MLTPLQGNIIEKVLRDPMGRLARVTFYVYENAGRMKARVVNVAYLDELPKKQIFTLGGVVLNTSAPSERITYIAPVASPYVDTLILFKLGSKPRAPAFL